MVLHNDMSISALVLAGGLSRRMGGQNKGLKTINGKPMISYSLGKLAAITDEIFISTNDHIEDYQQFSCPIVSDILPGSLGPLAGIHAGLSAASTKLMLVAACDCPFLNIELYHRLIKRMSEANVPISMAHDGERRQTTFVVINTNLKDNLSNYLKNGGRRLITWYQQEGLIEVDCSDDKNSFININSEADIETNRPLFKD